MTPLSHFRNVSPNHHQFLTRHQHQTSVLYRSSQSFDFAILSTWSNDRSVTRNGSGGLALPAWNPVLVHGLDHPGTHLLLLVRNDCESVGSTGPESARFLVPSYSSSSLRLRYVLCDQVRETWICFGTGMPHVVGPKGGLRSI